MLRLRNLWWVSLNLNMSSAHPTYDVPICLFFPSIPTLLFFPLRYPHIRPLLRPRYVFINTSVLVRT